MALPAAFGSKTQFSSGEGVFLYALFPARVVFCGESGKLFYYMLPAHAGNRALR